MADINTNLTPGDPLPTSVKVWNPILEAARKAAQGDAGSPNLTPGSGFEIEVRVKNTEATTCPRFAPIGIGNDAVFVEPPALGWIETPVLKGIFPADGGQIAIALEPIAQNGIGRAKLMGLVPATIDVIVASHTKAKPVPGIFSFQSSSDDGFPILWKQTGTGTKFGYVLIGAGSSGSKVAFVQAPEGGIPARPQSNRPGKANCKIIVEAPTTIDGTSIQQGDFMLTDDEIEIRNWTDELAGEAGSRLVQVDRHADGAFVIGWICNDDGDPDFPVYDPDDPFWDPDLNPNCEFLEDGVTPNPGYNPSLPSSIYCSYDVTPDPDPI